MSDVFALSSYNVLAQSFTPFLRDVDQSFLSPEVRYPKLIQCLLQWKHDIYALQEIEPSFLHLVCQQLPSYTCFFAQRGQQKPDGLAFLVGPRVEVLSVQSKTFTTPQNRPSSRLSQQLLCRLNGRLFIVAQAHLSWDSQPQSSHVGLWQMKQFLAGLPLHLSDAVVLCGDWNASVGHFVPQHAIQNGFFDALATNRYPTCWESGKPSAIDHIFHSGSIQSRPLSLAKFDPLQRYPNAHHGSDHLPVGIELLPPE